MLGAGWLRRTPRGREHLGRASNDARACQAWSFVTRLLDISPHALHCSQTHRHRVARPRQQLRPPYTPSTFAARFLPASSRAPAQAASTSDAPACAIAGPRPRLRQHHVALRVFAQCGYGKVREHPANMIHPTQQQFRQEQDLAINIRKATSIEETAPKRMRFPSPTVLPWSHTHLEQASMFAAALSTHGITRALPPSGRA